MSTAEHDDWSQYEPIRGRCVATSLPCPTWCALDEGHVFETSAIGDNPLQLVGQHVSAPETPMFRVHRRRFGERPTHVALETYERTTSPSGPSDLGTNPTATVIRVQLPESHGHVTAAGARRLAELLLQAADLADSGVEQ